MNLIGIVGGGPQGDIPNLNDFHHENIKWIGADKGAITLMDAGIIPDIAIGDFDSLTEDEFARLQANIKQIYTYPIEKDETDVELAIEKALALNPDKILIFGVTGGRLDHELVNIQLLYKLENIGVESAVINHQNWIELKLPGLHTIEYDPNYHYISFIPQSQAVTALTLDGFYFPLNNETIEIGSSQTVSNFLIGKKGTFSFSQGIVLVIKSHDDRQ